VYSSIIVNPEDGEASKKYDVDQITRE